jgi:hypothetical protein
MSKTQTELEGVIQLCRLVTAGSVEPFNVDVDYILGVIRKHYPKIESLSDFCQDASAIKELSNVLQRQNEWIEHQSTTLYRDPFLLNQQVMRMDVSAIADSFLKSWHPLVEMEQLSAVTLAGSLGYWTGLIPIADRWKQAEMELIDAGTATLEEAKRLGFLPMEGFAEIIEGFWHELKERVGEGGKIKYENWVLADTYEETVKRSYITVFMVGYGYANIETDRFGDNVTIIHNREQHPDPGQAKLSVPVLVDYEEWRKWRNG